MAHDEALVSRILSQARNVVREELERTFAERKQTGYGPLYDLLADYPFREGKGLRPAICLAACRAAGGHTDQALTSATALELFHNAFLVHDDVEDGSRFRRGEVVGIDLSAGMIQAAWRDARAHAVDNVAFFQADVGELPDEFTDRFDLVYNSLAHHHYPEPAAAANAIFLALQPGGVYCIVDPGPAWFNALSSPLAKWADPGWIGFHSPEEFRKLLASAGFAPTAWVELLPGFGLAIGQKP